MLDCFEEIANDEAHVSLMEVVGILPHNILDLLAFMLDEELSVEEEHIFSFDVILIS